MKKLIKRTAMTLTVLLALFGITTGVAFAVIVEEMEE